MMRRSRVRRGWAAALLALLLIPLSSACVRVQVSMGVSANDRVSGIIVAAAVPRKAGDPGPELKVPSTLGAKVQVEPYNQDGYVGSRAKFYELTFGEVQQLTQLSDQTKVDLVFQRAGDLLALNGTADLKAVPTAGADIQFKIRFPARVAVTNGISEDDTTVFWKLTPGEQTRIRAEVRYADPNTRGFAGWALIVGTATLAVAVIIGALAYVNRGSEPSPAP
jgi:hypothetical protein